MRSNCFSQNRSETVALYLVEHDSTVRETARHFGISKSTVHKDIREKLKKINPALYTEAVGVLDRNRCERHIRGGIATKNKYEMIRNSKGIGDTN